MSKQFIPATLMIPDGIYAWGRMQSTQIGLPNTESYFQLVIRMAWQCQTLGLTPTSAQVTQKHVLTQDSSMQKLEDYE